MLMSAIFKYKQYNSKILSFGETNYVLSSYVKNLPLSPRICILSKIKTKFKRIITYGIMKRMMS